MEDGVGEEGEVEFKEVGTNLSVLRNYEKSLNKRVFFLNT